jgi:GAF domain-containing protein
LWLEGSAEITHSLLSGLSVHEALRLITERTRQISGAGFVAVVLVDPTDSRKVVYESVDGLGLNHGFGTRLTRRGLTDAALTSGKPVVVKDLPRDDRFDPPAPWRQALMEIGLAMFMPLVAHGEALGVLIVGWRRGSPDERLAAGEVTHVEIFAGHAALALLQVQGQEDLSRRESWLEATAEMASLLLTEVDRDEAICQVVRQLRRVCGADVVGIILVDSADLTSVSALAFEGIDRPVPPGSRLPRQGLVAKALESGERIVSTDYTHQPGFQPPAEWADALSDVGLGMMIPLVTDKDVLGVLFVAWRRGSPHEKAAVNEVEYVQTFADLTAIALQRVRAQDDRAHLLMLEERNRIARDLNDVVLQRLFAAGLRLKASGSKTSDPSLQEAINATVHDLDALNDEIRSAIYRIRPDAAGE